MLEQFDGNCVQDGTKLHEEGVIFYSVFIYMCFHQWLAHKDGTESPASVSVLAELVTPSQKCPHQVYPNFVMSV